jgi:hypothetical protein
MGPVDWTLLSYFVVGTLFVTIAVFSGHYLFEQYMEQRYVKVEPELTQITLGEIADKVAEILAQREESCKPKD